MEALMTHLSGLAFLRHLVCSSIQALFRAWLGLGGIAIFLCGRGGTIYVLSVLSVLFLVHDRVLSGAGALPGCSCCCGRLRGGEGCGRRGGWGVVAGFCERAGGRSN